MEGSGRILTERTVWEFGTTDRNQRKPSEDDNLSQDRDMNPGLSGNKAGALL